MQWCAAIGKPELTRFAPRYYDIEGTQLRLWMAGTAMVNELIRRYIRG